MISLRFHLVAIS